MNPVSVEIFPGRTVFGHRSLPNTVMYIDLEKAVYGALDRDESAVRVAKTSREACKLAEPGFEYLPK